MFIRFVSIIVVCFLCLGIYCAQNKVILEREQVFAKIADQPTFVFDSGFIKSISFGHDVLMADLMWLDTVQYIGGHAKNMDLDILYKYVDTVTDLDPKFEYAYIVGELLLPHESRTDLAIKIGEKGMLYNPESFRIPYYLGFIHHHYLEDYDKAAEYYEIASTKEGALPSAKILAASAREKTNKHQLSLLLWESIYESTDNDAMKELAGQRMQRAFFFIVLEQAQEKYQEKFGKDIERSIDLVTSGFIPKLPTDPQGFQYSYNPEKKTFELR